MSDQAPGFEMKNIPREARFAVIAARFNGELVEELLRGCVGRLSELGISGNRLELHHVPGAFELPVAAKWAATGGKFSAVICLGAVVRGETPHFEYVAGEAARGIQNVALETEVPVIFGVLTTNNQKEARERLGGSHGHAGRRAAEAALEMVAARQGFKS
jgi:6,7-dimethyl-8-ribityllumazine synthase